MRFTLSGEQRDFAAAIGDLLTGADVPGAARAWATGDHRPGLAIWQALAKTGVTALAVPEHFGGLGATVVDLVIACEELGRQPVPGPIAESIAVVPRLLSGLSSAGDSEVASRWLPSLAAGELIATVAIPPTVPYALDADVAGLILLAQGGQLSLARAGASRTSMDRARRLFELTPAEVLGGADHAALALGPLASSALLLGAGRGLLDATVAHARSREQFGKPIGSFQAVKHQLADVLIALEFARPLLYAAAVALDRRAATAGREISAARVTCADAARLAARVTLQVHGAIGYTSECDVSLWLAKVRALSSVWGTQAEHRAVVLHALGKAETGPWN